MRELRVSLRFDARDVRDVGTLVEDGRERPLLELADRAGIKASVARQILDEVLAATGGVRDVLTRHGCDNAVSRAAADDVEGTARRLATA